jgi:hypothetical protein
MFASSLDVLLLKPGRGAPDAVKTYSSTFGQTQLKCACRITRHTGAARLANSFPPMKISAGTRLGRYKIRSKLGEGGMGEVYLAEDTELERIVALKVLPDELTSERQHMGRFMLEARAASTLNPRTFSSSTKSEKPPAHALSPRSSSTA